MFKNHSQDDPSKSLAVPKLRKGPPDDMASKNRRPPPPPEAETNQKLNRKIKSGELSFVPVVKTMVKSPAAASPQQQQRPIKRIKPTKLSDITIIKKQKIDDDISDDEFDDLCKHTKGAGASATGSVESTEEVVVPIETLTMTTKPATTDEEKTPINEAFASLLAACRQADPSDDMELLIRKKLTRYYQTVHPDYVNSKSFGKTALSVAADIKANPSLVYLKLTGILEELSIRRKSGQTVVSNEDVAATGTGNARKDYQIKRLNQALYVLKKKIARLDEADVDLSDECNSTFLLVERLKKRACEIYEKICDITGESKHAYRSVRKPITFQGTSYRQFNKTIETFVNRTGIFPDLFDVLRCLEHCNAQYDFKLDKDEVKRIGNSAAENLIKFYLFQLVFFCPQLKTLL